MTKPTEADIVRGRVFMLNPIMIEGFYSTSENIPTEKQGKLFIPLGGDSLHYFICLGMHVDKKHSFWTPLSSKIRPLGIGSADGQGMVPAEHKYGHKHFLAKPSWYDAEQVWLIQNNALLIEATANWSNDISNDGSYNYISNDYMDAAFPNLGDENPYLA